MEKQKVKVVKMKNNQEITKSYESRTDFDNKDIFSFGVGLLINALVLMLASSIFKGFDIANFGYALVGALVITLLTHFIKPFLVAITMPITIVTFGLFYPFINVIILKLTGVLLGSNFVVSGWIIPLFVSLFISFMRWLLESIVIGDKK